MVAVIIVNYNGTSDTIRCIKSLLKSSYNDYNVVIVDNASTSSSLQDLKSELLQFGIYSNNSDFESYYNGKVVLLSSSFNGGFAYANNVGAKYAISNMQDLKYLWFLNNDTEVAPDAMMGLFSYMERARPSLGILGNKLLYLDDSSIIQAIGGSYNKFTGRCKHIGAYELDEGQYDKIIPSMDYIVGASMFVRKTFVMDVGLMCEDYFLYFEELDWILRGKKMKWNFGFTPDVVVFHKEGGSTKETTRRNSEIADVCSIKNRILFTKKFYPICLLTVIPCCFLTILLRFIEGNITRAMVLLKVYIKTIIHLFHEKK